MRQHELSPAPGSHHSRKRVGRGNASGHGTYSGRGQKGQKSRSGEPSYRPGFEGGQLPLVKRLPEKRGFVNIFRQKYSVVNVGQLETFDAGAEIAPERLVSAGLVHSLKFPIKVLGDGELTRALTVKAHKFSEAAKKKIAASGGKTEQI